MAQKNYLLSPRFLSEVRETITRVNATPVSKPAEPRKQDPVGNVSTPQLFRVGTATGSWSKTVTNTVTWAPATGVTATVSATNLFADITGTTSTYSVAVARVGNDWYLVGSQAFAQACQTLTTATAAIVTDISISAVLNTSDCSIVVTKTLTTASITYATQ